MLTHERIWKAIDLLAARNGLSASGLARRAGLDSTSFNKSKRVSADGRLRWPSTESVAKILDATGTDLDDFLALVLSDRSPTPNKVIPLIAMTEIDDAFDDKGRPQGSNWNDLGFPELPTGTVFAVELTDTRMMPIYRDGDILVCASDIPLRRGDRVMLKLHQGDVIGGTLRRKTLTGIDVMPFGLAAAEISVADREAAWIARILWASQ